MYGQSKRYFTLSQKYGSQHELEHSKIQQNWFYRQRGGPTYASRAYREGPHIAEIANLSYLKMVKTNPYL